jgi:DNA-binding IclR family transcriptional regulator
MVHLVVLDKLEVLCIEKRESGRSLRIASQVGMRLPAHCSGVGKVLMAHLLPEERRKLIHDKGLPRFTENTLTDAKVLEDELTKIRMQCFAIDNEEIMDSLRCVATPIRDQTGNVISAMGISGPVSRMKGERLEKGIKRVIETAEKVSACLGHRSKSQALEDQLAQRPEILR